MAQPNERDILAERAAAFRVGRPGMGQVLRSGRFWRYAIPLVLILVGFCGWLLNNYRVSQSAAFEGIVVSVDLPREPVRARDRSLFSHYLLWGSRPAIITVRQQDGSEVDWKIEPTVARFLKEEDYIVKEPWRKAAVFRDGRQLRMTAYGPFRRDEVPLPSPLATP